MIADALSDHVTLTARTIRHVTRSPDTIVTTAVMPVGIMLLFVLVLGGAIDTGTRSGSYVDYLLPGVLLITIATGVSYTAHRLFLDLQGGIFDRFDSMPIARSAALTAHVVTSLVANLVSAAIVVAVALLLGFRSQAGVLSWIAVVGMLALVILALTWIAVVAGLAARSVEGASAFSYPLIFLPFVSSAFVPTGSMPGPVRWFAEHQPSTAIVNTIRALLAVQPVGDEVWSGLSWMIGILVIAWAAASVLHRRKTG